MFKHKFLHFVKNISRMDVLFGSSFAQLKDVGKPFTRCGLTKRYLQFIAGPPPRLYNKTTECVYPPPIGGEVKQWTGRTCPVVGCGFERYVSILSGHLHAHSRCVQIVIITHVQIWASAWRRQRNSCEEWR